MNEKLWRRDENWVGSPIEDSFVMVNIDSGKYVALNPTANLIWDALAEPRTPAQIEDHVRSQYDVSEEQCRESVAQLLEQMRDLSLAAPL